MKHLKNFSLFKEAIDIKDTDQPDEKLAKEQLNKTEEYLDQYKKLKPKIEQIYNVTKNPIEVQTQLDKIIPKDEKGENPFISQLLKINRLQKEILDGRKSEMDDKLKISEFNDEANNAMDAGQKSGIMAKLTEIKDRLTTNQTEIAKKAKELQKVIKEHTLKMQEIEKKLKEDTEKIKIKV
jgi:hypothetical protein